MRLLLGISGELFCRGIADGSGASVCARSAVSGAGTISSFVLFGAGTELSGGGVTWDTVS